MSSVAEVLTKVRALGADVTLERGKMTIVGSVHLNGEQRSWLAGNRQAIEAHLQSLGVGAADDGLPKTWGEFAHILYAGCPDAVDPYDWSWFVTEAGKIVRGEETEAMQ